MAEVKAVVINELTFIYPLATRPALRNVSLSVEAGEFVSIIGANGSGKSTLCQAIRGLVPKFTKGECSGRVEVNGYDIAEMSIGTLAREVGYVFQNPFTQMSGISPTVYEELAYGLGNLGVPPEQMRERVEAMLQETHLDHLRNRNPFHLSGGQQQRVALASILIMEQPILVIDEPTSQLDPETTNAMFELIAAARKQGKTIILVEHKMEKVAEFSDRIVVMHDGEILLEGTPAEVFSDPRCEQAGIRMPESMYLRRALDRKGLRLSESPLSVESLINDLEHRYGRPSASEFTVGQSKSPLFATPLLSIRDVEFSYPNGVKAVDQVSIDIAAGESVGIIGQNGAGKTTLAKLVNGLLKPSGGEIVIGGESTASWTAAQTARRVGYVFQNPDDQIFNKTVEDEVGYALTRLRFSADERATLITNALNLCGLSDHRNVNPYDLPPSIRKFVTIASVIALAPDVIILDEPTAGQDLVGLNRLITILQALKEQGKAILTITHDMEFVSQNFMRTIVMANRQVISDMPTSAVFYNKEILNEAMVNQPAFVQLSSHFADERIGLSMSRFAALFTPESAQQP